MRVTNSIQERTLLRNVRLAAERAQRAQDELSSGKKVQRPSDDPVAAARVLRIQEELRSLDQYRRNLSVAREQTEAEETVLQQVTVLLERAKEIAVAQASDTANQATRSSAKAEIDQLLGTLVQLGNTTRAGEWIFGGFQTARPPFLPGGSYQGDDNRRLVEIGAGLTVSAALTGRELLVDSGAVAALAGLSQALETGSGAPVQAALPALEAAHGALQARLGANGARLNQLDVARQNLEAAATSLALQHSELADASLDESVTRLATAQVTLQAALLAATRVLNTNLSEYLR